ncbi:hypothetical protein LNKW23_48670 [Paralimibaculum aggregatum]|uniref:DUF1468 domain-containing protein n=1 Tax=Paralimibaculum aggregatum TaxID=3036245 RepID=A0ABQ6LUA8_9RHOB|nr:tripartite tricarboxylate transporter TctB family protein [Limibaculum sp. NKW23]GMG85642.1 hypothetical protein LNKW23_48670 [Limibaculum sp. NKW23]
MMKTPASTRNHLRAAFSGSLVLFCLAMYASTYDPKYHTGFAASDPNALVLPRIVLALIVILAGIATFQELSSRRGSEERPAGKATVFLGIIMIVATALMPYVGFVLSVTPLVAAVTYLLGERRWYAILGTTALAGVGFWFLFHHVLLIRLPSIASGGLY